MLGSWENEKHFKSKFGQQNLDDRIKRHNTGRSTFTKRGIPWILVYQKQYLSKSEAYQAELYIKSQKSRKYIEDLIGKP